MPFDISLDTERSVEPSPSLSFNEFCEVHGDRLARALSLVCDDAAVASAALRSALVSASQRYRQLVDHPHQPGWVFGKGLDAADKALRDKSPVGAGRRDTRLGGRYRRLDRLASA